MVEVLARELEGTAGLAAEAVLARLILLGVAESEAAVLAGVTTLASVVRAVKAVRLAF